MRIYMLLVMIVLFCSSIPANAGDYLQSAHGNDEYGVNRSDDMLSVYATGNCAHCHEQHSSIDGDEPLPDDGRPSAYLLLSGPIDSASEETCFLCHGSGSIQRDGTIINRPYAVTFGGEDPSSSVATIEDAFNQGYTHDLSSIQEGLNTFSEGELSSYNNPCSGCHNVHRARANWRNPSNPAQSAISLPTDHENLWGVDDSDPNTYETMKEYAEGGSATYRAPFYKGATPDQMSTKHEPDGTSGSYLDAKVQGSTTLNYNEFCLECHKNTIGARRAINWGSTGDNHGFGEAGTTMRNQGPRIAPYTEDGTSNTSYDGSKNFVLSCTDCHEPHGSSNFDLLRTTVNGSPVDTNEAMSQLCYACHTQSNHGRSTCTDCHSHNGRF